MNTWQLHTHVVNTYCYYSSVFTTQELDSIVKSCDSLPVEEAQITGGSRPGEVNEKIRKTSICWVPTDSDYEWLYRKLTDISLSANDKWFGFDLHYIESLQYTVYHKKYFYDRHIDTHDRAAGQYPRKLSFTMQLSDPSDYEGGDVCLITGKEPFPIPKERGTITFFPSYVLHEVQPVTKGTRKCLVGWIHGPKWK